MQTSAPQKILRLPRLIFLHLFPGIPILATYLLLAPSALQQGFPGLAALLFAELFVLAPIELGHLFRWKWSSWRTLADVLEFNTMPKWWKLILWSLAGVTICAILYAPMFAAGLWIRTHWLSWLPDWFFDPGFGSVPQAALVVTFSAGLLIDGIVGPVVEEMYFRGYLLPRMRWMGNVAPLVNALLFTLYHFWQPHNYPAILAVSLVLSYAAWWKKSFWVSLGIHVLMNVVGSATGLLAAIGGVVPY